MISSATIPKAVATPAAATKAAAKKKKTKKGGGDSKNNSTTRKKPKRCMTAYNFFFQEERQQILSELEAQALLEARERSAVTPDLSTSSDSDTTETVDLTDSDCSTTGGGTKRHHDGTAKNTKSKRGGNKKKCGGSGPTEPRKVTFQQLGAEIGRRWKLLSTTDPAAMARYKSLADADAARYSAEMNLYHRDKISQMCCGGNLGHRYNEAQEEAVMAAQEEARRQMMELVGAQARQNAQQQQQQQQQQAAAQVQIQRQQQQQQVFAPRPSPAQVQAVPQVQPVPSASLPRVVAAPQGRAAPQGQAPPQGQQPQVQAPPQGQLAQQPMFMANINGRMVPVMMMMVPQPQQQAQGQVQAQVQAPTQQPQVQQQQQPQAAALEAMPTMMQPQQQQQQQQAQQLPQIMPRERRGFFPSIGPTIEIMQPNPTAPAGQQSSPVMVIEAQQNPLMMGGLSNQVEVSVELADCTPAAAAADCMKNQQKGQEQQEQADVNALALQNQKQLQMLMKQLQQLQEDSASPQEPPRKKFRKTTVGVPLPPTMPATTTCDEDILDMNFDDAAINLASDDFDKLLEAAVKSVNVKGTGGSGNNVNAVPDCIDITPSKFSSSRKRRHRHHHSSSNKKQCSTTATTAVDPADKGLYDSLAAAFGDDWDPTPVKVPPSVIAKTSVTLAGEPILNKPSVAKGAPAAPLPQQTLNDYFNEMMAAMGGGDTLKTTDISISTIDGDAAEVFKDDISAVTTSFFPLADSRKDDNEPIFDFVKPAPTYDDDVNATKKSADQPFFPSIDKAAEIGFINNNVTADITTLNKMALFQGRNRSPNPSPKKQQPPPPPVQATKDVPLGGDFLHNMQTLLEQQRQIMDACITIE